MLIGETLECLGWPGPRDDGLDGFVLVPGPEGRLQTAPLAAVRDREVGGTVYVSGGRFTSGTARRAEFLQEVVWLQLDADLKDFLGIEAEDLWAMDDDVLDEAVAMLARLLVSECERNAVPLNRVDQTGYGVCGYVLIREGDRRRVSDLQRIHRAIVRRINANCQIALLDEQVCDAGTRITRIPGPGAWNGKGGRQRPVRVLHDAGTEVGVDALLSLVTDDPFVAQPVRPMPSPQDLTPDVFGAVEAIFDGAWGAMTGSRHDVALGLAGVLHGLGVSEADTMSLMERIASGDEEARDRLLAVRSTYRAAEAGQNISGWSRLRRSLPPEMKSDLETALAPLQAARASVLVMGGEAHRALDGQYEFEPPPESCFRGWVGEYRDAVAHTTEAGDAFHLATALTVIGGFMGRRAWCLYGGQRTYPSLFSVLVGSAGGSRKDSAVKRGIYASGIVGHGLNAMQGEPYHLITDIGSSQALIANLAENEQVVVYLSELAKVTRNARRTGTSDIMPTLLQLWDCPNEIETVSLSARKEGIGRAEAPFLSLIACIQPEILSIEFGAEDSESGLTSRLSYFCGTGKADPLPDPPAPDPVEMQSLYSRLASIRHDLKPAFGIPVDPDTRDIWAGFYRADRARRSSNLAEDRIRTRLATKVKRYALIYAVSERSPMVGRDHLLAGIDLVEWEWGQVTRIAGDWGASVGNSLERRIKEVLSDGPKPRWYVRERVSSPRWGPEEIARVMRSMRENGTVLGDEIVQLQEGA